LSLAAVIAIVSFPALFPCLIRSASERGLRRATFLIFFTDTTAAINKAQIARAPSRVFSRAHQAFQVIIMFAVPGRPSFNQRVSGFCGLKDIDRMSDDRDRCFGKKALHRFLVA
jgi:hypothetical protein